MTCVSFVQDDANESEYTSDPDTLEQDWLEFHNVAAESNQSNTEFDVEFNGEIFRISENWEIFRISNNIDNIPPVVESREHCYRLSNISDPHGPIHCVEGSNSRILRRSSSCHQ